MQIRILVLAGAVMLSGGVQMRAQMTEPPAGAAGWDKGRADESSGRLALRDGGSGSWRGQGHARR